MSLLRVFFFAPLLMLASCVPPPPGGVVGHRPHHLSAAGERSPASSASSRPIQPGEVSSAYRLRQARQQREAIPDAQLMYQHTQEDAWGRSSQTGTYRRSGGVVEELHIGNQQVPILPGQPPYARPTYQGGFVPPGTTAVYDPVTGRLIPVRR